MNKLESCTMHDAIIEDRNGKGFSMWYALVNERVWFVEYVDGALCNLKRVELQEVLL